MFGPGVTEAKKLSEKNERLARISKKNKDWKEKLMTGDEKKERKAEKIIENEEPPDVKITKALCKTNIFSETLRKR